MAQIKMIMKAYTDLEQSKTLAEILSLESADMRYERVCFDRPSEKCWYVKLNPPFKSDDIIPCWSLAALLSIIPKRIKGYNILRIDIKNDFAMWYDEIGYGVNNDLPDITADNPVEACYEMIIKLKEENKL